MTVIFGILLFWGRFRFVVEPQRLRLLIRTSTYWVGPFCLTTSTDFNIRKFVLKCAYFAGPGMKRKVDDALLARARRMATRTRAGAACLPCKFKKAKCNDYRPCKRCLDSGSDLCTDGSSATRSNSPECLESGQDLFKDSNQAAKSDSSPLPVQTRGVAVAFTEGGAVSSDLECQGSFHPSSLPPTGHAMDVFENSAGRDIQSGATDWNEWPAPFSRLVR